MLLGAEYVAILGVEADALDTQAPLVAGALLAVAELAYWSLELRAPVVDEAGTYLRRIALLATLVLGVVGLGADHAGARRGRRRRRRRDRHPRRVAALGAVGLRSPLAARPWQPGGHVQDVGSAP